MRCDLGVSLLWLPACREGTGVGAAQRQRRQRKTRVITCVVAKRLWRQFFFGVRRRVAAFQAAPRHRTPKSACKGEYSPCPLGEHLRARGHPQCFGAGNYKRGMKTRPALPALRFGQVIAGSVVSLTGAGQGVRLTTREEAARARAPAPPAAQPRLVKAVLLPADCRCKPSRRRWLR